MIRILVVDDDRRTLELLAELLVGSGFGVETATTGEEGLLRVRAGVFDLVVLDVMLPGKSGFDICQEIRSFSRIPVVMLTARGEATDRILGLDTGADDYLPKPFDPRELIARISAVLRRSNPQETGTGQTLRAGPLELDGAARTVRLNGQSIEFTTTEFDILRVLVSMAGRVVARERLMELARGQEFGAFDRSIDVHLSHIRRKLGDDSRHAKLIKTIRGVGYQLTAEQDAVK